jgi:transcription antitermination factor NusG
LGTLGSWYAVQTKPHKEGLVLEHASCKGITAYRPCMEAPCRRGRRVVPLFPNYVFVRLRSVEECVSIRYTPGVRRLLGVEDGSLPIDDAVIELIRMREGEDGLIRPSSVFHFRESDRVRLRGGPFNDLEALFQRYLPGRNRVQVLLSLLGRVVPMQLAADEVLPVAM